MKKLLMVCMVISCVLMGSAFASDYYVANDGIDDDSITTGNPDNGRFPETPWQTIDKVNNSYFQTGDTIHFRCGDEWREQLNIPSSGVEGSPITFTGYGADCNDNNKPVIDASAVITGWSQYSGSIYVADVQLSRAPENLIINSTFDINDSQWGVWPSGMSDNALKSYSSSCDIGSGGSGGGCIIFTSSLSYPDNHLSSNNFPLDEGYYSVKFRVASVSNVQVTVNVIRGESPWDNLGYSESFTADASGEERSFTFQAASTLRNAILLFFLPPGQEVIRIDDISVKPVSLESGTVKQVFVDGQYLKLAQYPDSGYFIIDEHTSFTSETCLLDRNEITDASFLIDYDLPSDLPDVNGAGVHIRTTNWSIEDRTADTFDTVNHKLTWINENSSWQPLEDKADTFCAINKDEGYYLDNKLWMLDQPGEWFYDGTNRKLYVWLPDSSNPSSHLVEASHYENGIVASMRNNIVLDNLRIRHTAIDGIVISDSSDFLVSNMDISDSGRNGIYVDDSPSGVIQDCVVENSINQGINVDGSDSVSILRNRVENTGTVGSPKSTLAAISISSDNANITGNTVRNSGYNGINFSIGTLVNNNIVERSCLVLNDCAGIYTWNGNSPSTPSYSSVVGNIVIDTFGNIDGTPSTSLIANGIYLDDFSKMITVEDNIVVNASYAGIVLHNAADISAARNTLYGNQYCQLTLYTGSSDVMQNNIITENILFPLNSNDHVRLRGDFDNIYLGDFDLNTYSIPYSDNIVMEQIRASLSGPYNTTRYTLGEWNLKGMDLGATLFYPFDISSDRVLSIDSGNFITNSTFDTTTAPWGFWSSYQSDGGTNAGMEHVPYCNITGGCLKFTSGTIASDNHMSSYQFPLVKDKTYMLEFKASADRSIDNVTFMVRKAEGPYWESVGLQKTIAVGTTWHNHRYVFTADQTLSNSSVDFYLPPGAVSLFIDGVIVSEVTAASSDTTDFSDILINKTSVAQSFACPSGVYPQCDQYIDLYGNAIVWPVTVEPFSSKIIVWTEYPYVDTDHDGVLDVEDNCPNQADPFLTDSDGDGFGTVCDCNDNDNTIFPGALELCDSIDNNCNGDVDESSDADGDGYATVCGGDCNDNDATVNPAASEICDSIDNNCDGIMASCNPSGWYNDPGLQSAWQYRQAINIAAGMTTSDLDNFPVLIVINEPGNSVFTQAQTDGDDIIFTDSLGTKLDYELEKFDPLTGELVVWVRMPLLAESGIEIYMYYGNADALNQQNRESVWDGNYVMVQHLSETSGQQHVDSTPNNNDSTSVIVAAQGTAGKIGGADEFAVDNAVTIPDSGVNSFLDLSGNGPVTFSAWVYARSSGESGIGGLFSKGGAAGYTSGYKFSFEDANCAPTQLGPSRSGKWGPCSESLPLNTWTYAVFTFDPSTSPDTYSVYFNSSSSVSWPFPYDSNADDTSASFKIGEYGAASWDGFLDEVRISNTARSAEWIAAEYNNQNNPGNYIQFTTSEVFCTDSDNDGYAVEGGACGSVDCNDNNAAIKPGVPDANCNGIDENCSGTADEGYVPTSTTCGIGECASTGQLLCQNGSTQDTCTQGQSQPEICDGLDNDCDGPADNGLNAPLTDLQAGACSGSIKTCNGAGGWVNNYSGIANYEAIEITCDTLDNDCDGQTDEGVQNTYYLDADTDTYGNTSVTTQACAQPSGYVTNNTDCNDGNAAIKPGAAEVCDSIDNNCNGTVNDGVSCSLTWNGSSSTDWGNAGNWNLAQVPDSDDDVIIPNVTRKPVFDTARTIKSITIQSSSSLDLNGKDITVTGNVTNSGTLNASGSPVITVGGDWNFTGTFTPGTSTMKFISPSATSTISGSKTYYNMIFDSVSSDKTIIIASGTTITVTGTLTVSGNYAVMLNTGTITAQGNILVGNTSPSGGGTAALNITGTANQTLTGSGTVGTGRLPKVTISKTGGTLALSSVISIANNWTYTRGVVNATANDSTVAFYGAYNLDGQGSSATMAFDNVILAGTTNLAGALDINGNLTINPSSTLNTSANNYGINVAGNWTNNGAFTANNSTVTFDSAGASVISGSTAFYRFVAATANKTLSFTRGTIQTVRNKLTLNGTNVATRVRINATGTGSTPKLTLLTGATQSVQYVEVTNNDAGSGQTIKAGTTSICSGACTNWTF